MKNIFISLALTPFVTATATAIESEATLSVIGHKPQLKPLILPEGSLATGASVRVSDYVKVGNPVSLGDMGINLSTLLTDSDGDREGGSVIEWSVDGGSWVMSEIFTADTEDGGQRLSVRVTPKTLTGIPNIGDPTVSTNSIIIKSGIIQRFTLHPNKITLTHADAVSYCNSIGMRLPTLAQLRAVFFEGTSLKEPASNTEMCSRYGWPLGSLCGGSLNAYWANTYLDYLRMNAGTEGKHASGTNIANVACIK